MSSLLAREYVESNAWSVPGGDHATDILSALTEEILTEQRGALVVVTGTEGGSVRAAGALVAVSEGGQSRGYISNGCVDADMVHQARESIETGRPRRVRYGAGSPYYDISLPCGGSIELLIIPNPDLEVLQEVLRRLYSRQSVPLAFTSAGDIFIQDSLATRNEANGIVYQGLYEPRLRLHIAGRGADMLALCRLAMASGFDVTARSPDTDDLVALREMNVTACHLLTMTDKSTEHHDDPWTAVVLMFHDHDWEHLILHDVLCGGAFYVGALGSNRTQTLRKERLKNAGLSEIAIERLHGPIGLIPAMRNSSMLAISILAEVVEKYNNIS